MSVRCTIALLCCAKLSHHRDKRKLCVSRTPMGEGHAARKGTRLTTLLQHPRCIYSVKLATATTTAAAASAAV
eukprot:18730-Heterococcus_DN1.PRE.2